MSVISERTRIHRFPERSVRDRAEEFLAQGLLAHVGFTGKDGSPFVIPFGYHYDPDVPDRLYLHGSVANHALRQISVGTHVCVTMTMLDGLVYSRTAFNHSMNYRSVVCFGHATAIADQDEKNELLEKMIDRYWPGRTVSRDYYAASTADLRQTLLVEVRIDEMSAKTRAGGPKGPGDDDPNELGSAGVVALADLDHNPHQYAANGNGNGSGNGSVEV